MMATTHVVPNHNLLYHILFVLHKFGAYITNLGHIIFIPQRFFENNYKIVVDICGLLCYDMRAFVENRHDREGFIMKLRDDYEYTADNRHTSSFYGVFHDRWDRVQKFQEEACKICSTVDYDGLPKRQVAGDSRDE